MEVLNNYDEYYRNIYGNMTNYDIFKDISEQWNNLTK